MTDYDDDTLDGVLFRFWIRAASSTEGWPMDTMRALMNCTSAADYRAALIALAKRKGVNLPEGKVMTDLDQVLPVGSLLLVGTGYYSDHRTDGPVRMRVSKTKRELADEFRADAETDDLCLAGHWDPGDERIPDSDSFLPWLIRKGYAEDPAEPVNDWHVGDGEFSP